jgi:phosphoenolpyruvate-protein kinase (PTS system EI component)
VAAVKARLRGVTRSKVERLAAQALACSRADEVRALPLP